MKSKKIFSLILVMTIILSGMTAVFGFTSEGPISGNDNNVLNSYTEYKGTINPNVSCYFIKDEAPGTDKVVDLGYGYSMDLDYSQDNDYVTPTLQEPTLPTHTIEVKFINVKASPAYIKYTDLLLDGTEDLYSVYNDTNGKYHGISHVSIVYCFTPKQPETGTLVIEKEVWIDGVLQQGNTDVFTFTVDGETVTASAVEAGEIVLETGSYVVTETGYGDYTPDAITQQAIVTTQGGLVTFVNRYTTPEEPEYGTLIIEKEVWIDGVKQEENTETFTFTVDGETVTASAVEAGQIVLETGSYVVTETGYGDYTPDAITQQAIVTTQGGIVTFVNRYTTPEEPEYGTLIIEKEVWIDGVWQQANTDVFTFTVDGETVTATVEEAGQIELETGSYVVTETGYGRYTPDAVTQQAIVTTQGGIVTFVNRYTTPEDPEGYIRVEKTVEGNRSDEDDVFNYEVRDGQGTLVDTIIASQNEDGLSIALAPGIYTVTEEDPAPYRLLTDNDLQIEVFAGQTSVAEFTNRYNVTVTRTDYDMTITKTADENEVNVGDTITYTIKVKNTGDATLTKISVVDEMVGLDEVIESLAVNQTETFTVTYVTTSDDVGFLENTATATDDRAGVEEADAAVIVNDDTPLGAPGLSIEKTVIAEEGATFKAGDKVQFKITVTNIGTQDLVDVLVKDEMAMFETTIPMLSVGESESFDVYVTLPMDYADEIFENIATASNDKTGTLQDTAIVILEEEIPRAIPETGVNPMIYLYGIGSILTGVGALVSRKKK